MGYKTRRIAVIFILTGLCLTACAQKPATASKIEPAMLEEVAGSDFKRVILTEKAAERLGIQTTPVRIEQVIRTRRVGGRVIEAAAAVPADASAETSSGSASPNRALVQIQLSASDLNNVDRNQAARVLPIGDDEEDQDGLEAEPDEGPGVDDGEEEGEGAGEALYYAVDNSNQQLSPGQGVLIDLTLSGTMAKRLVIPYAAVVYGLQGETWVFTNPEPYVYIRQPIVIDYIEGEMAFLSVGPASDTPVVVVGAAELYGTETGVSK